MEGSRVITEENIIAIEKDTGKYVSIIKEIIDDGEIYPMTRFLDKKHNPLSNDYVGRLRFDEDIDWEARRYEMVRDFISSLYKRKIITQDDIDIAIITSDRIINSLKKW